MSRELSRERSEGQRGVLAARDALLERVFAEAHELLSAVTLGPASRTRLLERAREALRLVPAGEVVVRCSPDVARILAEELELPDGARIETQEELLPGFRVTGAGGAVEVDCTLAALLELERPVLAIEVLRRLDAAAT